MDVRDGEEERHAHARKEAQTNLWNSIYYSLSSGFVNGRSESAVMKMRESRSVSLGVAFPTSAQAEDIDEQTLLHLMRRSVVKLDPLSKEVHDATLRRFLVARSMKVDKACTMFVAHQRWRRSFTAEGYVPEEQVKNELETGKVMWGGYDKQGHPFAVGFGAKHGVHNRDVQEFKRYTVYIFDKLIARMPPGTEKFTFIVDLQGVSYCNLDPAASRANFDFLQAYYPERLAKVFVVHVPVIFWGLWRMISPFVDKVTKEKIVFVEDKALDMTLMEYIDKEQLPSLYGGRGHLQSIKDLSPSCSSPPVAGDSS